MFEILKPDKKAVGRRLRQVKDELNLSFTDFGNRLGLKKSTINAYVRGDNLAPLEVLEKVSKIYGKPQIYLTASKVIGHGILRIGNIRHPIVRVHITYIEQVKDIYSYPHAFQMT